MGDRATSVVMRRPVAALLAATTLAMPHPLHTSLAQLTYDPAAAQVTISLRVFADDFGAAVTKAYGSKLDPAGAPPASDIQRYVSTHFALLSPSGTVLALSWCGVRYKEDTLLLCFRAPMSVSPTQYRARNALMAEVFDSQVNMVQVVQGSSRRTFIFTKGDGPKPLK